MDFTIVAPASIPPQVVVAAGDSTPFIIRFLPRGSSQRIAALRLQSDASNAATYDVPLEGFKDSIGITASDVEFGSISSTNFPQDRILAVRNSGTIPIQIQGASFPPGSPFQILSGLPASVNPNATVPLVIRFNDPGSDGQYTDELRFQFTPSCADFKVFVSGSKWFSTSINGPAIVRMSIPICTNTPKDTVIVITNPGTDNLLIQTLSILQDSSFRFNPKPTLPASIAPGNSLAIPVRYAPAFQGDHFATLRITSNALNAPVFTSSLVGRKEHAELRALSLYFGTLRPADFPVVQSIEVTNVGNVQMRIDSLFFGGAPPFQLLGGAPVVLGPGQRSTIPIRFVDPGADGYYSDTLSIIHSPTCTPLRLLVAGTKISAPFISAPGAVEFATQLCSFRQSDTAITVTNTGVFDLILSSATLNGSAEFTLLSSFPKTIKPGQSTTIVVRYQPIIEGLSSTVLTIISNAANEPSLSIFITARAEYARIEASPLDFGIVTPQDFPVQRPLVVRNESTLPITLTASSFKFPFPFDLATSLPVTIPAGDSTSLSIRFSDPGSDGSYLDSLNLQRNFQCGRFTVAISGTRSTLPNISAPSRVDFGTRLCGGPAFDTTIVVRNTGGSPLVISDLAITSGTAFVLAPPVSLPLTIQPMQSDVIPIRYIANTTGSAFGEVTITSNSKDFSILRISLLGEKDSVNALVSDHAFGILQPASFPVGTQLSVRNTGTRDITITAGSFFPTTPFSIESAFPIQLAVGASTTISIRFNDPGTDGDYNATLSLTTEPSCEIATARVSGTRQSVPGIVVARSLTLFPLLCTSGPRDTTIEIRNSGSVDLTISSVTITGDPDWQLVQPPLPMTISPGGSQTIRVSFTRSSAGSASARLTVTSNDINNPSVEIQLNGSRDILSLLMQDTDFGTVFPGSFPALRTVTIRNASTISVRLDSLSLRTPSQFEILSSMPRVLAPGDSAQITLRFHEPATQGSHSSFVTLRTSPSCEPIQRSVTGTYLIVAAILRAGNVRAAVGETILIPFYLDSVRNLAATGVTAITATLRFNRTLLRPLFQSPTRTEGNDRLVDLTLAVTGSSSGQIAALPFMAGLGNDTGCVLTLENASAVGGVLDLREQPGSFSLSDVCREGGYRLLNPDGEIMLKQNRPNPFNPITEIEYEVIEPAHTRLIVLDNLGRIVATLVDTNLDAGRYVVRFDASSLSSGMYHYVLLTPTVLLRKTMSVVK